MRYQLQVRVGNDFEQLYSEREAGLVAEVILEVQVGQETTIIIAMLMKFQLQRFSLNEWIL